MSSLIEKAAQRLEQLRKAGVDIDPAAPAEAGGLRLERTPCNAATVIDAVVQEVEQGNATAAIEVVALGDARMQGDPDRLAQVASNLIGNAWKYSGKKEAPRIEFGFDHIAHFGQ